MNLLQREQADYNLICCKLRALFGIDVFFRIQLLIRDEMHNSSVYEINVPTQTKESWNPRNNIKIQKQHFLMQVKNTDVKILEQIC